jgi:tetratricopeptide (TPR) repeat protein
VVALCGGLSLCCVRPCHSDEQGWVPDKWDATAGEVLGKSAFGAFSQRSSEHGGGGGGSRRAAGRRGGVRAKGSTLRAPPAPPEVAKASVPPQFNFMFSSLNVSDGGAAGAAATPPPPPPPTTTTTPQQQSSGSGAADHGGTEPLGTTRHSNTPRRVHRAKVAPTRKPSTASTATSEPAAAAWGVSGVGDAGGEGGGQAAGAGLTSPTGVPVVFPPGPPVVGESSPGDSGGGPQLFNMGVKAKTDSSRRGHRKFRSKAKAGGISSVRTHGAGTETSAAAVEAPPIGEAAQQSTASQPGFAHGVGASGGPPDAAAQLAEADRLRSAGNTSYHRADYTGAVAHYSAALSTASSVGECDKVSTAEIDRCQAVCLTNRAAALKMTGQLCEAIRDCRAAMEHDPTYTKAFCRAAKYHLQRAETDQATECMEAAQTSCAEEDQEIVELRQSREQIRAEMDEIARHMAAGDGPAIAAILARAPLASLCNCPRLRAVDVGARLLCGQHEQALFMCQSWTSELSSGARQSSSSAADEDIELAWTAIGRCHLFMCKVDDVAKLPSRTPCAAGLPVVELAREARECKSRGNVQFQAGQFSAAEASYSDGASHRGSFNAQATTRVEMAGFFMIRTD